MESGEAVAVTVGMGLMTDERVMLVAHCPTLGVKIYTAFVVLLMVAGFHVPTIPFGDVFDNIGATPPKHIGGIGAKFGKVGAITVTVKTWLVGHAPEVGVKV